MAHSLFQPKNEVGRRFQFGSGRLHRWRSGSANVSLEHWGIYFTKFFEDNY